jgi:hypothetical protein
VDDDKKGAMAMMDVAMAVKDNAAPLVIAMMTGMPKAIAVMVTTTILLTTDPVNITISWTMKMNDDNNNADNSDDGEDSLPPPMTATTAEMMMGMMGGGGVWRGNATINWTRGTRGA